MRGVRGSGMKSRRYITRLLLFSFLLAVPVWAQDEVAPDPDAATPAPGQARHLPTIFGRDAIFSGIGAGEERLWKKKASPSTCSTLRICRAIRREDCSNPGRDGKNTRDDRHQFRQDQRFFLELRCVAGRDVTGLGKSARVERCLSTDLTGWCNQRFSTTSISAGIYHLPDTPVFGFRTKVSF